MSRGNRAGSLRSAVEGLESRRLLASLTLPLDSGFGTVGSVSTPVGTGPSYANSVAVQADGKIVAAGYTVDTVGDSTATVMMVARYNTNGKLDDGSANDANPADAFGVNGVVEIAFSQYGQIARAVAIQRDGKIVVAGEVDGANDSRYWMIARLNADGSRDKTFGRKGIFTAFAGDNADLDAIALQPDGKIVAAGAMGGNWLVARMTGAGAFDPTFHDAGYRTFDFGGSTESAAAVAIDNLSDIVVGGTAGDNGAARATVIRLLADGTNDPSFGTAGVATSSFHGYFSTSIKGMGLLPNGYIILAGHIVDNNAITHEAFDEGIDVSFNMTGKYTGGTGYSDTGQVAVAVSPVGGYSEVGNGSSETNATSHIDSIGSAGLYTPIYPGTMAQVDGAVYAPDGKLYVAGTKSVNGTRAFAVACYDDYDATQRGSASGVVYVDTNANGLQDKNEKGQADVRVYVDVNDDGTYAFGRPIESEKSVLTDSLGRFTLAGILPGTYSLREQTPSGYERTTSTEKYGVTVVAGHTAAGVVFGNRLIGSGPIAGGGFASLADGVLTLQGTGEGDQIGISYKKGNLNYSVDGDNETVALSLVSKIVITAFAGNDKIGLAATVNVPANIDGGDGDDTIVGGPLADTINGAAGNDMILGGAGDDRIAGADGDDTLDGGDGRDRISGQDGDDSITGDGGRDILSGGNGNDTLIGGASSDYLYGNAGNDILNGLSGADNLDGGDDTDTARRDDLDTRLNIEVLV